MRIFITALLMVFAFYCLDAQVGAARIYAGATVMTNSDVNVNPEGMAHTGYALGVDARLMSGGMSFLIGGRYAALSRNPIDGFKLTGHEGKLTYGSIRGGLDFSIFSFSESMRIRTKLLGSIDLASTSGESNAPDGYDINDGWMSGVTGLGADLGPIIVDLELALGFLNSYFQKDDTKFNSWTFSVGFQF